MDKIPMTRLGFEQLQAELKRLKSVDRPSVIQAIAEARSHGDLSENAEYDAAKERQGFIEGRIAYIEDRLSRADVIDVSSLSGSKVKFGASVKVVDEDTDEESIYHIVGVDQADLSKRLISYSSPVAKALIGKNVGESVSVTTPGGTKSLEILSVSFG
jgi:transcription elongation factor GreA